MSHNNFEFHRVHRSDLFPHSWTEQFSYRLALHHRLNRRPLTKEQFEFAVAETSTAIGLKAHLTPANTMGADVQVQGERWSLKTQADKAIRSDVVNIHKVMEAGKGDLITSKQREQLVRSFMANASSVDRILVLRCLPANAGFAYPHYELLEIPGSLLQRVRFFPIEVAAEGSRVPRSFAINVYMSEHAGRAFQLYFDGGSERKLRLRHLRKDVCLEHVAWSFPKK